MNKLASIKRLSPSVLVIFSKKVNEILEYFKASNLNNTDNKKSKSYAQVSKVGSSIKEILKIKNIFPSFKVYIKNY